MLTPAEYVAFAAVLAAVLVPCCFMSIRESVKKQRQEIVRDLQAVFDKGGTDQREAIPSFEFVKYKYFLERDFESLPGSRTPKDFDTIHWVIGSLPLIITTSILNMCVLVIVSHYGLGYDLIEPKTFASSDGGVIPVLPLVILGAYAGAYLFMFKAFFRAIHNFDLSPLSFIGAWVNLVTGIGVALIFVYGFCRISSASTSWASSYITLQGPLLLLAYFVGRLPELATRNMFRSVQLRYYKQENTRIFESFSAIPVEVIDGIDSEIRDRLSDFHITAVQNLAAANPLLLYVETPFGVYQIMDWVAQAELCCSVGPTVLLNLWKIGIRTIFDLERAVLDCHCYNKDLVLKIGSILLVGLKDGAGNPMIPTEAAVIADVRVRVDNPHVHRLRQLFIMVADRIGSNSRRLPPLEACPNRTDHRCLYADIR